MEQFAEFPLTTFSTKKLKVASFTIFVENYLNISCKKKIYEKNANVTLTAKNSKNNKKFESNIAVQKQFFYEVI